ncbi:MAG: RDD family protein [Gammaproteobacteria bacterium SHHR-1]|uniref:RDD family protein n=1 Tax=Magnetovirga frankeli TaxID=947516 RepID=UPI00129363E0|nr:RDD family protein [gamma proteobacterium SS-5]
MTAPASTPSEPPVDLGQALAPGLLRRLAALFYDALLLLAVLVVASILPLLANGGETISHPLARLLFQLYLLLVVFVYFGWHWSHGGQTLGMRAWRLRALRSDGHAMGWGDALKRFAAAGLALLPLGLGLIWCLFDRDGLAWHDRLSASRLVLSAKRR